MKYKNLYLRDKKILLNNENILAIVVENVILMKNKKTRNLYNFIRLICKLY